MKAPGSRTLWLILALLGIQTALFFLALGAHDRALVDDAFISFRYAARLADGEGLTWNDGLSVEGYSNPLWMLTLAGLARLGIAPHSAAPWLGLFAFLATSITALFVARKRALGMTAVVVASLGIGLDLGAAVWAGSGLESALTALLVVLWLLIAAGHPTGFGHGMLLGLLASGLALSRPEGFLWVAWGLFWLIWWAWVPRRVLLGWGLGLLPAAAYLILRVITFGRLVPNTFFAKLEPATSGLGNGLEQLGLWVVIHAAMWVVILLWGIRSVRNRELRLSDPWVGLLGGFLGIQMTFVLLAGGDWMGHHRYLVPVLPALCLLAGEALQRLPGPRRFAVRSVLLTGLLLVHLGAGFLGRDHIPTYTRVGEVLGKWLKETAEPGELLAITASGAIPYFSGLSTHDVLGINDPRVSENLARPSGEWIPGHRRYDIDRLIAMEPDWIVWDFSVRLNKHRIRKYRRWEGDRSTLNYRQALLAHPRFEDLYQVDTTAPAATQNAYTVFRRR